MVLPASLILVAAAPLSGLDRRALARDAEAGRLVRVRRGAYVQRDEWDRLDEAGRHRLMAHAAQAQFARPLVFSHWTAAALLGLPTFVERLARVHVTVPPDGIRGAAGLAEHALPLPESDVIEVEGLRCTGWERCVVDLAASERFSHAVAVADAALHRLDPAVRELGREALRAAWRRGQPRRERGKVADVIAFADGRSESVGESLSRCTMRALRVPPPELQHEFYDRRGRLLARVDFWFPEFRVAGEMDGRVKYLDPALSKGDPARVVYEEKLREDAVRAQDVRFARWGYREADSPALLGPRLEAAGVRPR